MLQGKVLELGDSLAIRTPDNRVYPVYMGENSFKKDFIRAGQNVEFELMTEPYAMANVKLILRDLSKSDDK